MVIAIIRLLRNPPQISLHFEDFFLARINRGVTVAHRPIL